MLTFFEYLRERAHRSILAGVEDALEDLEGPSPADDGDATGKLLEKIRSFEETAPSGKQPLVGGAPAGEENSARTAEPPPPRKRGRPRKARPEN